MKMKKLLGVMLVVLLALTMVLSACDKPASGPETPETTKPSGGGDVPPSDEEPVRIGLFTSMTGSNAPSGAYDVKGAEVAIKHINEDGGVLGRKVELVLMDSTSESNQSALILERELSTRKVAAIVGNNTSSICLTQLPVLEKHKVAALTGAANIDVTSKGYTYIFRPSATGQMITQNNVDVITYLAKVSGKPLDEYNVGIVYENSPYGKDCAEGYADACEEAGLKIVVSETYPVGALTDASPIISKLKNNKVDLVFCVSAPVEAKLITSTMKTMEYAPLLVGGGTGFIWPTILAELGEEVNGTIAASAWNYDVKSFYDIEGYERVVNDFEEMHGEYMSEQCGQVYSFMRMIVEAIENAGTDDSEAVRNEIAKLTSDNSKWFNMVAPGSPGMKFREDGQSEPITPLIIQWQDNRPRTIWPRELSLVPIVDIAGNPIKED